MTSGTLGQWKGKENLRNTCTFQHIHTQNMGQDNNSHTDNVHNMTSGTLGQWIGKKKKYMHFQHKYILKTWDKTATHVLRM